jgi:hypothetical protein
LGSEAAQSTKTSLVQDKELGGHATLINFVWSLDSGLHGNLSLSQFYVQANHINGIEIFWNQAKRHHGRLARPGLAFVHRKFVLRSTHTFTKGVDRKFNCSDLIRGVV